MANANLYTRFCSRFPRDKSAALITTPGGGKYSYADAEHYSASLAHALTQLGLKPGDRVTVQTEKSVEFLWLYLACLRSGLIFHPLNTAYTGPELAYFLADARPQLVVCQPERKGELVSLAANYCPGAQVLTLGVKGEGSLLPLARQQPEHYQDVERAPEDIAALLYSSGTTGRPKGIMLSHHNLASNAETLVETWGFGTDDTLLHALPVFHIHGLFVAIGCTLMAGATMIWLDRFDTAQVLDALPFCTVMMGVPTYYTRLLASDKLDHGLCTNMRLFISGSAPLLEETHRDFKARTGHAILERYGMTETGMNISNPLVGERRGGTVGLPLPGVNARIVDDKGLAVPVGEVGNLQIKGPNVFRGYWQLPDKTAEDFTADGWFNTGDKATVSVDGYYSIVGRAKDMVICGGLNVYPKEVEQVIDNMPGVRESAVIGVPHPDFGEAVVAVVIPGDHRAPGSEQIIATCRQQLANFKIPKAVFFVDALPRNAMGKVQKNVLRERYGKHFPA